MSKEQCRDWCVGRELTFDANGFPDIEVHAHDVFAPFNHMNWSRLTPLSELIVSSLQRFDNCLLWVTEWGVWSSSENLHLFYRLRETYGERRPLDEVPGHWFLRHESADLVTFVELCLLFGWDFYVLAAPYEAAAFVSHDEFLKFRTRDAGEAERVRRWFEPNAGHPNA